MPATQQGLPYCVALAVGADGAICTETYGTQPSDSLKVPSYMSCPTVVILYIQSPQKGHWNFAISPIVLAVRLSGSILFGLNAEQATKHSSGTLNIHEDFTSEGAHHCPPTRASCRL